MTGNYTPQVTRRRALTLGGSALLVAGGASAITGARSQQEGDGESDGARQYRVTVANLTRGQPFTPPAVALHQPSVEVFSVGEPANEPTRELAENGNLDPLLELVQETDAIRAAGVADSPLVPEDDPAGTDLPYYASLELAADASATHMTFASMLIATNDGIVGLDTVELPEDVNESMTYYANGYDVGTEQNTEQFGDLVPPAKTLILGGEPEGTAESDSEIAEDGVITPHPGIEGDGDLPVEVYDWREPAALVQVERIDSAAEPPQPNTPGNGTTTPPEDGMQTEFQVDLSGENEVPPVDTGASGQATLELTEGADGPALEYEITVQDIQNVVAAHIHCGGPAENGPVGVTLFEGGPFSADGTLVESTVSSPDAENDCEWSSVGDVVDAMRAGETYVNVHTQGNPAGEIRGQLP